MKKIIIGIVVALVVLAVVALAVVFFSLNSIVKKGVETVGPQMTKVEVRLGSADISPFSGSGGLNQLFVGNPDGYKTPFAIQMGSIKVGVRLGSVFSDTVVVDEINIQDPEITLEGTLDGNNLSTILNNLTDSSATQGNQTNAPAASGGKTSRKFIVKDLALSGAKVHVNVSGFGRSVVQTVAIPDLHLQNIGNGEGGVTPAQLSWQILQPVLNEAIVVATDELKKQGVQQLQKELNKQLQKQGNTELNKAAQGALTNLFK
jgi:uncharacterized protein involved in outer membrane biogenesis